MFSIASILASLTLIFYSLCTYGANKNNHDTTALHLNGVHPNLNGARHDKWIVLVNDNKPADNFSRFNDIPGWKAVIVGYEQNHTLCSKANCKYLSYEDQGKLGFQTNAQLPRDPRVRKSIGYLYAISKGAKVIYDTVPEVTPRDNLTEFILGPSSEGLMYDGIDVFNPYQHFGQATLSPRGFPFNNSASDKDTSRYLLGTWRTPLIQHQLVEHSSKSEDIFKPKTRSGQDVSMVNKKLETVPKQNTGRYKVMNKKVDHIKFDSRAPPAFVPSGVFAPTDSGSTLFLFDAFWGLVLPSSTTRGISDILRGYWAQRLLWEVGGTVGFFPPRSSSAPNKEDAHMVEIRQKDMSFKIKMLVEFLSSWYCDKRSSFFDCMRSLSSDMADRGFWGRDDVKLVHAWLNDLTHIGYSEPRRTPFSKKDVPKKRHRHRRPKSSTSSVQFVPDNQFPLASAFSSLEHNILLRHMEKASLICPKLTINAISKGNHPRLPNILLVIPLTSPNNEDVKLFEALYSFQFPHIVYCGKMKSQVSGLDLPVTYIDTDMKKGSMRQRCLIKAMEMNYRVDGYLFLSENTLLNVWTLKHLPMDRVWYVKPPPVIEPLHTTHQDRKIRRRLLKRPRSHFKRHRRPRRALRLGQSRNMLPALHKSLQEIEGTNRTLFRSFQRQIHHHSKDGYVSRPTDVTFIPERFKWDFLNLAKIFTRNEIPHDVAIPTAIGGLVSKNDIYFLDGYFSNSKDGHNYQEHFHKNFNYLHPVDLTKVMKSQDGAKFICELVLPLVFGI